MACRAQPIPGVSESYMSTALSLDCSTSNELLIVGLGKQQKMAELLYPLHPHGRPGKSLRLLASDRPNSSYCGQLGSDLVDGRSPSLLSVHLPFQ